MSARLVLLVSSVLLCGMGLVFVRGVDSCAATDPSTRQLHDRTSAAPPERLEVTGIDNLYRLSPRLYSGAQPEGDAAFGALQRLGVKTIISVDGARPDLARAYWYGLRYVHLPFGYDGVPRDQRVRLVKTIASLPRPVFVHCHHGKHRGPAAAATCALATEGWSRGQGVAWLKQAGTAPEYRGLFDSIAKFEPPSEEELKAVPDDDLPQQAEVPGLVELMVEIDRLWDRLKAAQRAGFRAPSERLELDPPHEALMLMEQFREAGRQDQAKARGAEFLDRVRNAEQQASILETALRAFAQEQPSPARFLAEVDKAFTAVGRSCTGCHSVYRDN